MCPKSFCIDSDKPREIGLSMKKIDLFSSNKTVNLILIGIILQLALYAIPTFPILPRHPVAQTNYVLIFIYLTTYTFLLLKISTSNNPKFRGWRRYVLCLLIFAAAYALYTFLMFTFVFKEKWFFLSSETTHFITTLLICLLIGHSYTVIYKKNEKEKEVERLRSENLSSKCEALMNQMNPHFFFNLLNGLSALIRDNEKNTSLVYVDEMAKVFRYIMQINNESLITLERELQFLDSYRYLLEIRYMDRLSFDIDVPEHFMDYKIPTLSLLPVVENIPKHNVIDKKHKMNVSIRVLENDTLMISNPIFHKIRDVDSNKVGLTNLSARYKLLVDRDVEIVIADDNFNVLLPLIKNI